MEIKILLNPKLPNYGEFQAELSGEINALQGPGISITSKTAPPPTGTLGLGEIFQYILDNQETIVGAGPFIQAAVEILLDLLRRHDIKQQPVPKPKAAKGKKQKEKQTKKPEPMAIIIIGEDQLYLPCSEKQAREFIKKSQKKSQTPK